MVGVDQDTENLVYRIRERIGIDPISRYLKSRHSPEPGETVFIPTGTGRRNVLSRTMGRWTIYL